MELAQQAEDWEAAAEAWQWDGRDVAAIMNRLPLIQDYFPHKLAEWEHTIPEDCRGKVSVETGNPENSEEVVHRSARIIAMDNNGNALVLQTSYNTYTDEEEIINLITPVDAAMSLIQGYKNGLEDCAYHSLAPAM
jgi:hypothetical protein